MSKFVLCSLFLFLSGCASTWQSSGEVQIIAGINKTEQLNESIPKNQVHVFVYKESGFTGSATAWPVQLNNKRVGMLKNGTYMMLKVAPGMHILTPEEHITLDVDKKSIAVKLTGGKRYFFAHHAENNFWTGATYTFKEVPSSVGANFVAEYAFTGTHIDKSHSGQATEQVASEKSCSHWSASKGITDEDKAWEEIKKNIKTLRDEALKAKNSKKNLEKNVKIKGKDIPFDKLLTGVNVLNKVGKGDFKGAAEDVSSELIGYLVPFAGQYKALLDAVKTSGDTVIKNWTESLYLTPAFQDLETRVLNEVKKGAAEKKPYYASGMLERRSKLFNTMFQRESIIYHQWKRSQAYEETFNESKAGAENWARIRQVLKKQPLQVEIYKHFYEKILSHAQTRSYIKVTYDRVSEDLMYDEMVTMKPMIIKSVCRKLANITKK